MLIDTQRLFQHRDRVIQGLMVGFAFAAVIAAVGLSTHEHTASLAERDPSTEGGLRVEVLDDGVRAVTVGVGGDTLRGGGQSGDGSTEGSGSPAASERSTRAPRQPGPHGDPRRPDEGGSTPTPNGGGATSGGTGGGSTGPVVDAGAGNGSVGTSSSPTVQPPVVVRATAQLDATVAGDGAQAGVQVGAGSTPLVGAGVGASVEEFFGVDASVLGVGFTPG